MSTSTLLQSARNVLLHFKPCRNYRKQVPFFVTDNDWTGKMAETIGLSSVNRDRKQSDSIVFQVNPGGGMLAPYLLSETSAQLVAWEPRDVYWEQLNSFHRLYPGRYELRQKPFERETAFNSVLRSKSSLHQTTDFTKCHVNVVGYVPEMGHFVMWLLYRLYRNDDVWRFGGITYNLFVNGLEHRLITEAKQLWKKRTFVRTSLYYLFFDFETLLTIPLSAFNRSAAQKYSGSIKFDRDNMFLVRLSLKPNIFTAVCKQDEIAGLIYLLRIVNRRRCHRAIPTLERWCPDVGIALIDIGVTMMDRFCDLPLSAWPKIYAIMTSSRHYEYSTFKNMLLKSEGIGADEFGALTASYDTP